MYFQDRQRNISIHRYLGCLREIETLIKKKNLIRRTNRLSTKIMMIHSRSKMGVCTCCDYSKCRFQNQPKHQTFRHCIIVLIFICFRFKLY